MKFYNRENEISLLESTRVLSENSGRMTMIIGRRRIGKTTLIRMAFSGKPFLYLFVTRKNEALLCQEYILEAETNLGITIAGEFRSFSSLFEFLLIHSQRVHFTLALDEFQEFQRVNPGIFSEMQHLWDRYKAGSKMNLILCGSVYSLMKKIFEHAKEPLFGRINERIHLQPFSAEITKRIFFDHFPNGKNPDLLAFYTLTGGIARYLELMTDKGAFTLPMMLDEIFRNNSLLLEEGKDMLIGEFGKDYSTYFSILSLIASSKTSRTEIESILDKDIGGFLDRLENDYQIIRTVRPVLSKPGGRIQKYLIDDNFLNFWFRFIFKFRSAIEIGNLRYVRDIVSRDFPTFSGPFLEKYFLQKTALSGRWSEVGQYWEKGNQNQLDIVALNESEKTILIAEVKLNKKKIDTDLLKLKSAGLLHRFSGYRVTFSGYSPEDM